MKQRLSLPDQGRILSKQRLRGDLSQRWENQWEDEAKQAWNILNQPESTAMIQHVLQQLKSKQTNIKQTGESINNSNTHPAQQAPAKL